VSGEPRTGIRTAHRGDLEVADCPLCGSADRKATRYTDGTFRVVRCRACRAWYTSPRLREAAMLAVYGSGDYFEGGGGSGYAGYRLQRRSLLATFRRLVGELERRGMAGGDLLDVGCGYGYFLEAADGRFRTRTGTDFSAEAAAEARGRADAVHVGGVDALPADARFDCITTLHVIEHVYDPRPFVQSLFARLRPGGWLVVATPDMGSGWRRVMGNRWPSFKLPEHVVFYDRSALDALLGSLRGAARTIGVPYPHAFPLAEVCAKLGVPAPSAVARLNIWMPATTVCVALRRS
jgi:2-polyprenyl-3-methyl-5-hydroxy-6-metoxy-1,4-benzoquinol methylase